MSLDELLDLINTRPERLEFSEVTKVIEEYYDFTPVSFHNGDVINQVGENSGSCRVFAFAQIHELSQSQTLQCFGAYYRVDVLQHPERENHPNIRQFMKNGWAGIHFEGVPLARK